MQSAKAFLICMNACSGVTVDAQGNGRDDGGAMAGRPTSPSVEGRDRQKPQITRRNKTETPPDSPTSKSDICKPIILGVAFQWHFLILVQAVRVNKFTLTKTLSPTVTTKMFFTKMPQLCKERILHLTIPQAK